MPKIRYFMDYIKKGIPQKTTTVSPARLKKGCMLSGHKVLITGGDRGIGLEIAKKCIQEQAMVTITGTDSESLGRAEEEIKSNRLFTVIHNTSDVSRAWVLIKKAADYMEGVDCLVHGDKYEGADLDFRSISTEEWDKQMDIELKGIYFLTQSFVRFFSKNISGIGKVLMLTSERGYMGDDRPHGLAKAALASYTEGMAKKLIPRGIRVNALSMPYDGRTPFGQVADSAVFLLSDAANCISGVIIPCGMTGHIR